MEKSAPRFEKQVFVCENKKESGVFCGAVGEEIRTCLREGLKARGLQGRIRVSKTGCLGVCADGPNVLLMPDNLWYKRVQPADLEALLDDIAALLKPVS